VLSGNPLPVVDIAAQPPEAPVITLTPPAPRCS